MPNGGSLAKGSPLARIFLKSAFQQSPELCTLSSTHRRLGSSIAIGVSLVFAWLTPGGKAQTLSPVVPPPGPTGAAQPAAVPPPTT